MKNLKGIEIINSTEEGQSLSLSFYEEGEKKLLSLCINEDVEAYAYLTKEELDQHIEVCKAFLDKF